MKLNMTVKANYDYNMHLNIVLRIKKASPHMAGKICFSKSLLSHGFSFVVCSLQELKFSLFRYTTAL